MPEFAKSIEVTRDKGGCTILIDGKELPWHISEDGISTRVARDGIPSVTVTILAEDVQVSHKLP